MLPEKRAAAEELRLQTCASKTPSMGSAAKAAAAVRCEHEDRIQSLHADVCKVSSLPMVTAASFPTCSMAYPM